MSQSSKKRSRSPVQTAPSSSHKGSTDFFVADIDDVECDRDRVPSDASSLHAAAAVVGCSSDTSPSGLLKALDVNGNRAATSPRCSQPRSATTTVADPAAAGAIATPPWSIADHVRYVRSVDDLRLAIATHTTADDHTHAHSAPPCDTAAFLLHASWAPRVHARRLHDPTKQALAALMERHADVPLYVVDVDLVPECCEELHVTSSQLPILILVSAQPCDEPHATLLPLLHHHYIHRPHPHVARLSAAPSPPRRRVDGSSADKKNRTKKIVEKLLKSPEQLLSALLIAPVHSVGHLRECMDRFGRRGGPSGGGDASNDHGGSSNNTQQQQQRYVIVYFGAAWCAPCMRILPQLPALKGELSKDGHEVAFVKADYDAAPALRERFGVVKIPTFAVFRCDSAGERPSDRSPNADDGVAPVAMIQTSQVATLRQFIDTHCALPLKFTLTGDEDF